MIFYELDKLAKLSGLGKLRLQALPFPFNFNRVLNDFCQLAKVFEAVVAYREIFLEIFLVIERQVDLGNGWSIRIIQILLESVHEQMELQPNAQQGPIFEA